jgi:RNA polymerase sigma-70 factor (ECF subfamily)
MFSSFRAISLTASQACQVSVTVPYAGPSERHPSACLSRFGRNGTVTCVSTSVEEPLRLPRLGPRFRGRTTAREPDVAAIEGLFLQCERRIGKFLVQMVRDRSLAEDLLQDTFHDAFRSRSQLFAASNPEAWLFATARNRALSALRRQRRSLLALARLPRAREQSERGAQEVVALHDLLERHLDPDERALLFLRYLHGFDAAELAEIVGISPEAVRQRLSRSRRKLIAASAAEIQPTDKEGR